MIKPAPLNKGDTIGIVSTSYPYARKLNDRYNRAIENLKKLGYNLKIGDYVETKEGFVTASPEKRAEDINKMFLDKEVKAILCVNGGAQSSEVLPFLDYDLIKKNPKIFCGYSDVNSISLGIYAKTGIITFNGPMLIPQFGEFPNILNYSLEYFEKILSGKNDVDLRPSKEWTEEFLDSTKGEDNRPRKMKINDCYEVIKGGNAQGRILSGNLRIICSQIGTSYLPDFAGKILFLEDLEISTAELKRNLEHLSQANLLNEIKGVVFGRILMLKEKDGVSLKEVLLDFFKEKNIPIIIGMDFGHTDPVITIPNGVLCEISDGKIFLREFATI